MDRPHQRTVDERVAVGFWLIVLSVVSSFVGALVALALHIDQTMLYAKSIGSFLACAMVLVFAPWVAAIPFGQESPYSRRDCWQFRLGTLMFVSLVFTLEYVVRWPSRGHGSAAITAIGFVAAMLACWFLPHFPGALRVWVRQNHPLPKQD